MKVKIFQNKLNENLVNFKDKISIECGNKVMSYGEIDKRSNCIANWIIGKKIKKGSFIGILLNDRIDFIMITIGILKAGCVLIPLDPSYPNSRVEEMINTTGIKFIISDEIEPTRFSEKNRTWSQDIEIIPINELFLDGVSSWFINRPDVEYSPEDRIYVYFTSGTSGKPNAIVGKNKSLLHFIDWEIETFNIDNGVSRFSQLITTGFDAFLRDIFVPLCSGGVICIPDSIYIISDPVKLINWVDESGIHLIHCVPSLFRLLNSNGLTGDHFKELKYVLLSGEKINPSEFTNWYDTLDERIQLVNLYGPTETTMIKTYYFIQKTDVNREIIPIGKPMRGARIIICDENMKMCTKKRTGELYIRTPFGTFGYYNNPDLNKKRFIKNPFMDNPDDVLYKTGDMGRFLADGNIELLGRIDRQVKIRGIRIELEGIERILVKHRSIKEAVVMSQEVLNGSAELVAFITLAKESRENEEVIIQNVTEYLSETLPTYMIPAKITVIEEIPRKPNGKVDFDVLPDILQDREVDYIAPRNSMEMKLFELWIEILGNKKIGVGNRFFELGANSLNVMSLINKIHIKFDIRLSLKEIFENPTIEKLSQFIHASTKGKHVAIEPAEEKEYYALSTAQQGLNCFQNGKTQEINFNLPTVWLLKGELDRDRLVESFREMIKRHESLRTSFEFIEGEFVQKIQKQVEFELEFCEVKEEEMNWVITHFRQPFDLSVPPLFRIGLLKVEPGKHVLIVDVHQTLFDGTSRRIFQRELMVLYGGGKLPALKPHYKDYSEWQTSESQREIIKEQKRYWLNELDGYIPWLDLPFDYERPATPNFEGKQLNFEIGEEKAKELKMLALEADLTLYILLLAVFNVLLARITDHEDIAVGTLVAGRRHESLKDIVGRFVNTLVLRNYPKNEKRFTEFLKEIKKRTLEAFENQEYPLVNPVEPITGDRVMTANPFFNIRFAWQNIVIEPGLLPEVKIPGLTIEPYYYENTIFMYDLAFTGGEIGQNISFKVSYSPKLFKEETIKGFISDYQRIISNVLNNPEQKISEAKEVGEGKGKRKPLEMIRVR